MNRKKFLKKSLLGVTGLSLGTSLASVGNAGAKPQKANIQRIGFNHLPNKEERTMKTVLHKANTRGHANHGWLDSHHTFSFANYHHPERMNFGALRVLNDDVVAGGRGFGTHPHDNMEIISIPLQGDLEHKDSMGTSAVIKEGDVQVMSAGTGIYHSEYNKNSDKEVRFLQIWLFPNQKNVKPRYDQISLKKEDLKNNFHQILSPNPEDEGVWIHQNAWFHLGELEPGVQEKYSLKDPKNGVYAFVLEGSLEIEGQELARRDGFGLWDTPEISLKASEEAKVLLMEVPMG